MDIQYDLVVIGAGPGGYIAAVEAAKSGLKTAIVEKNELGGTCLNRGCIPTKSIMHAAGLYRDIQSAAEVGIFEENIFYDMQKIHDYKNSVVEKLRNGVALLMKNNKIHVYKDKGIIIDRHHVTLNETGEILTAENILIATGSRPAVPKITGIGLPGVMTSDELLTSEKSFEDLVIIGGGVIGIEFASIYSALGVKVTIVEAMDRILANMDKEISQNLKMILKKRGVDMATGASVTAIGKGEDGRLICTYEEKGKSRCTTTDGILVAVGRKAVTEGLFAEDMSVSMERGYIAVDGHFMTSVPGVYAIGDVNGKVLLAHAASAQGICAVHAMRHEAIPVNAEVIPSCVYTEPEIACVGMTKDEARAWGMDVIAKKYLMSANGKSVLTNQERGFIKIVADVKSHKILGAQMMCGRATDMISEFTQAIVSGLTLEDMARTVRPHPTFSEAISEAVR